MTTISALTQAAAGAGATSADRADLKKAAKAFEAIFVRQLIGAMRGATDGADDLTGSSAVSQFQEMADAKTADSLADSGGLGIAALLLKQLGPEIDRKAAAIATSADSGSKAA